MNQEIVNRFRIERKGNAEFCVVEGYHALKHAFRFGAEIRDVFVLDEMHDHVFGCTVRDERFEHFLQTKAVIIERPEFEKLSHTASRTGVIARARKLQSSVNDIYTFTGRIVVLENPRDLNNVGAVVRVCAAHGNTTLVVTGETSPWHTHAVRGAAGLQWALPIHKMTIEQVLAIKNVGATARRIYTCTDEGRDMYKQSVPNDAVLIFGTERDGITPYVRTVIDHSIAIPMQNGVSSMNLATSVSAVLFGLNQ